MRSGGEVGEDTNSPSRLVDSLALRLFTFRLRAYFHLQNRLLNWILTLRERKLYRWMFSYKKDVKQFRPIGRLYQVGNTSSR